METPDSIAPRNYYRTVALLTVFGDEVERTFLSTSQYDFQIAKNAKSLGVWRNEDPRVLFIDFQVSVGETAPFRVKLHFGP